MRTLALIAATTLVLTACGDQGSAPAADFHLATDMNQTMAWIVEPAADVIWDSAGAVIDTQGETDLAPTTDEAWQNVVNAASVVAESGNLLMLPGRSMGADWNEYARGLTAAGKEAMAAAQARDANALFDAGGRIYVVCRACHNQYWVEGEQ
jgi:hypothetical protein